jgi:hypothetical protein
MVSKTAAVTATPSTPGVTTTVVSRAASFADAAVGGVTVVAQPVKKTKLSRESTESIRTSKFFIFLFLSEF